MKVGSSGPRRQGREAALQVLFAVDTCRALEPPQVARIFAEIVEEFSLPSRARARALELALGVARELKTIDEAIAKASDHWKLHRLATVDRNVLRVATFELLYEPATPAEVIIDEAVEIARRFSSETSPGFVNGVLDMIAKQRAEKGA